MSSVHDRLARAWCERSSHCCRMARCSGMRARSLYCASNQLPRRACSRARPLRPRRQGADARYAASAARAASRCAASIKRIGHPQGDALHLAVGQAPDVLQDHVRLDAVDRREGATQPVAHGRRQGRRERREGVLEDAGCGGRAGTAPPRAGRRARAPTARARAGRRRPARSRSSSGPSSAPACSRRSRTGAATASASSSTPSRRSRRPCRRPCATACIAPSRWSTASSRT